jgi:DNA polymerase-3 subunit gamma/tau
MSQQPDLIPTPEAQPEAGSKALFEMESQPQEDAEKSSTYLVLARKYRPINFTQLIGQEAMVRTLGNAFERNRIPHAIMLTGMRGVGKTTTARIIARALNYTSKSGEPQTSIEMENITDQCRNILESRHPDVIEMDAASRTGISDIREIIDSAAYRPVMARKKIYIIDEVHMLSTAAFNGLLKTLEEPPDHVMFIFATTEIRKVPVTILSRCQRFDLRRLTLEETNRLLSGVLEKEKLEAEEGALLLLARAAEGSARDALSLLDQAIAHNDSENKITEENIKMMLGLAGRAELLDLFDSIVGGKPQEALADLQKRFDYGADPLLVLGDLADVTHFLTRRKLAGVSAEDYKLASNDRERATAMAEKLTLESLSRIWQMLLKGLEEARFAPDPYQAAEMILVRITHAQTLPTMQELARVLENQTPAPTPAPAAVAVAAPVSSSPAPAPSKDHSVAEVLSHFPGAKVIDAQD